MSTTAGRGSLSGAIVLPELIATVSPSGSLSFCALSSFSAAAGLTNFVSNLLLVAVVCGFNPDFNALIE